LGIFQHGDAFRQVRTRFGDADGMRTRVVSSS
jgi:hypothetical protein